MIPKFKRAERLVRIGEREVQRYRSSTCQAEGAAAGTGSFSNVALLDCHLRIIVERLQWLQRLLANPELIDG